MIFAVYLGERKQWPTFRATRPSRIDAEKMAEDADNDIAICFVDEND